MSIDWTDFQDRRAEAPGLWSAMVADCDPAIPRSLPPYFVDRLVVSDARHSRPRAWRRDSAARFLCLPHLGMASLGFASQLAGYLGWSNALPDSLRVQGPETEVGRSSFLLQLLNDWTAYIEERGISAGDRFAIGPAETVESVHRRSLYHPGAPAIAGPTFYDILGAEQVVDIAAAHGPSCLLDFYVALAVIHEESHQLQAGDPLLAEIGWSAMWLAFIKRVDLLEFQFNRRSGLSCNLERDLVDKVAMGDELWTTWFLDTARAMEELGMDAQEYLDLCDLSRSVHKGLVSYQDWLHQVGAAIARCEG